MTAYYFYSIHLRGEGAVITLHLWIEAVTSSDEFGRSVEDEGGTA